MTLQERLADIQKTLLAKLDNNSKLTLTIQSDGDLYRFVSNSDKGGESNFTTLLMLYAACETLATEIGGLAGAHIDAAATNLLLAAAIADEALEQTQHGRN